MTDVPTTASPTLALPPTVRSPLGFLAALVLAMGFTAACGGSNGNPKRVNVLFPDRDGLETGDPVRYQGFEIGEVSGVEPAPGNVVRIALDIDREYEENLREGAEFLIEDLSDSDSSEEEKLVRLSMPKRGSPLLPDSATVVGEGSRWEQLLDEWREKSQDMAEEAKEEFGPWIEKIRQEVEERSG